MATLQIFTAVAQTGSISRAARQLGMSQQAVSARMRAMEAITRLSLLQRATTGAQLTPHGQALLKQTERILAVAQDLQQFIAQTGGDSRSTLEVAASQTVAEHLVPHWLMQFKREHLPDEEPTDIAVHVGNTQDVLKFLRTQTIELGFVESPAVPTDLNQKIIGTDQLELVVTPNHPWAQLSSPLDLETLAGTPLVMREQGSGTRDVLEHAIARFDRVNVAAALELGTTSAVRSAAIAGIAPSFLSLHTVADDVAAQRLVIVPTELGHVTRPFTALWHGPVHRLSKPAQAFLKIAHRRL